MRILVIIFLVLFSTSCTKKYKTIGDQYLKSFVYVNHRNDVKNLDGIGMLRPINNNSDGVLREFLPVMLYKKDDMENPQMRSNSVVYSKVKVVNGVPWAYDIRDTAPQVDVFDFTNKTDVRLLIKEWGLDVHNMSTEESHPKSPMHKRGHVWQTTPSPEDTKRLVLYIIYDEPPIVRDTLIMHRDYFNDFNLQIGEKYFFEKGKYDFKVGSDRYYECVDFSKKHTHKASHKEGVHN